MRPLHDATINPDVCAGTMVTVNPYVHAGTMVMSPVPDTIVGTASHAQSSQKSTPVRDCEQPARHSSLWAPNTSTVPNVRKAPVQLDLSDPVTFFIDVQ